MIAIDKSKCTSCGICAEVCPSFVLKMQDNYPAAVAEKFCISCGHCVAVCPEKAFDHVRNPLKHFNEINNKYPLNEDTALNFLRGRRSIRNFKQQAVENEKILSILNAARYAPSAGNSQSVRYIVVRNKPALIEIQIFIRQWIAQAQHPNDSKRFRYYKVYIEKYMSQGIDVIFRDAPVLIAVITPKTLDDGFSNTRFALAYAELFAPSIGLGTCWAGFFEMCGLDHYTPLYNFLQIPEDQTITGGLMLGYPKYTYYRLPGRSSLNVDFL